MFKERSVALVAPLVSSAHIQNEVHHTFTLIKYTFYFITNSYPQIIMINIFNVCYVNYFLTCCVLFSVFLTFVMRNYYVNNIHFVHWFKLNISEEYNDDYTTIRA